MGITMAREKILVVEDEDDILELIRYNLSRDGYKVRVAESAEQALSHLADEKPDLLLLDLMLPGMDGLDLCRMLKRGASTQNIPIIMLTAKSEEADIVTGLEMGSDDYVTKPFSPRVLLARIKAVLRRKNDEVPSDVDTISIRNLTIDPVRHEVLVDETRRDLTATEFSILHFLAARPGWVFTREQIISSVKGDDYPVTDRSVDVQIVGLRKKLGNAGKFIETVRGVGYRFRDDV
jgi:two-component system, OmpR family, alkaline phosphatase synthesis response regulator PhoP